MAIVEITGLSTDIRLSRSVVHALDRITLHVEAGETLGIVGESGCGKTMLAMSIEQLLPPGGHIVGGQVTLGGRDLVGMSEQELRRIRGSEIGMIFQDPMTSLNPVQTVGLQVAEPLRLHRGLSGTQARAAVVEMFGRVGIPSPARRFDDYPHQLSGGQRQRVMIAMALICQPTLLIADEPTTALDVTIQKQILDLINDLRRDLGMAVILVTHDLGVIAGNADRVAVMYAGQVVEVAGVAGLFARSRHRYSEALFAALPGRAAGTGERLYSIPGMPPDLTAPPPACRFAARCTHRIDRCLTEVPALEPVPGSAGPRAHAYACFVPRDPAAHDPAGPAPSIRTGPAGLAPSDGRAAGDIAAGGPAASASSNHAGTASTASTAGAAGRGGLAGRGGRGVLDGASWIAPTTLIPDDGTALTQVTDLVKEFPVRTGAIRQSRVGAVSAVAGVTLRIDRGETVGLVGESGCGKTTLGRLIVGLDAPTSGEILFRGRRMDRLRGGQHREARRNVQLMFQDSYSALDPRMRVRAILREPLEIQRVGTSRDRDRRVDELLDAVGLPRGAAERYPHEFSGGQRQRIGLARALALQPGLIVADEPVSALDVSVQAQILNLMKDLQRERALTYLFISHDLAVVRYLSDRIAVMYLGKVVETGPSATLYAAPLHPYTKGLIDTVPVPDPAVEAVKAHSGVAGEVPSALHPPSGCRFRTRCPRAEDICAQVEPPLRPLTPGGDPAAAHEVACHFPLAPVGLAGPGRDERADPRLGPT